MKFNYEQKDKMMAMIMANWKSPVGFRSTYKGVPMNNYDGLKQFIDFTKYSVMFRGPRKPFASSTRKCDAKAFDVYQKDAQVVRETRIEQEAFARGVRWANNRNH